MGSYVVQSGSRHCFSNARLGNAIKDIGIVLSAYLLPRCRSCCRVYLRSQGFGFALGLQGPIGSVAVAQQLGR